MNDLLDYASYVSVALHEVEIAEAGGRLVMMVIANCDCHVSRRVGRTCSRIQLIKYRYVLGKMVNPFFVTAARFDF